MSQPEQLPLPPQEPNAERSGHLSRYDPLGQDVLRVHEISEYLQSEIAWGEAAANFADSMGYRVVTDESVEPVEPVDAIPPLVSEGLRMEVLKKRATHTYASGRFKRELADVRSQVRDLPQSSYQRLESYIEGQAPEEIRALYAEWKDHNQQTDPANWLAETSDEQLTHFLAWHNRRIDAVNMDPEVQNRFKSEKQAYKSMVADSLSSGGLPANARDALARVDEVLPNIGDDFDTVMIGRNGYHRSAWGDVVLKEGYKSRVLEHELSHAVLGFFSNKYLNEAMTELSVLALHSGDFSTADPARFPNEQTYLANRYVLHAVSTAGIKDLLPQAWAAFCSRNVESSEYQTYLSDMTESFAGVDINELIDVKVDDWAKIYKEKYPDWAPNAIEHYALMETVDYIIMLGGIARGLSDEEILSPWAARANVGYGRKATRQARQRAYLERRGYADKLHEMRNHVQGRGMATGEVD